MVATSEEFHTLLREFYPVLRTMAGGLVGRERRGLTLQRTELVHEAFARLSKNLTRLTLSRESFLGLVGHEMRILLVDHARRHNAQRRGGHFTRVPLLEENHLTERDEDEILALNEALDRFGATRPRAVSVVELKFFAGFTTPEIAAILGLSDGTIESDWSYARAWLYRELTRQDRDRLQ